MRSAWVLPRRNGHLPVPHIRQQHLQTLRIEQRIGLSGKIVEIRILIIRRMLHPRFPNSHPIAKQLLMSHPDPVPRSTRILSPTSSVGSMRPSPSPQAAVIPVRKIRCGTQQQASQNDVDYPTPRKRRSGRPQSLQMGQPAPQRGSESPNSPTRRNRDEFVPILSLQRVQLYCNSMGIGILHSRIKPQNVRAQLRRHALKLLCCQLDQQLVISPVCKEILAL